MNKTIFSRRYFILYGLLLFNTMFLFGCESKLGLGEAMFAA